MSLSQSEVEASISTACQKSLRIVSSRPCPGGSINDCQIVSVDDGREFFLKTNKAAQSLTGMFELEFKALLLLSQACVIRVPQPLLYTDKYIVMETFVVGQQAGNWAELMGRQLAQLHKATANNSYGFEADNYLGTTLQKNTWCESWMEFWRENRLATQLNSFANKSSVDDRLLRLGWKLVDKLDSILGQVRTPAALLHGDLWSGNASADEKGEPVIFDPAIYYGHNEAEIGMMRMFGGFGPRCEAAYVEIWPFDDDSERRIDLYRLYHELNHLNLFGNSYYDSCLSTLKTLL